MWYDILKYSVHGLQGEFRWHNTFTKEWEGNPIFDEEYQAYFELLKNRDKHMSTSTQALPMLSQDLKVIMEYLDGDKAQENMSETKRFYFKAFVTTAFCLWTW